ncbi:transmembrane protein 179-like [Elysia marginata]|uniref:Transmembrane protein 179-like n=1 Tax=Elysia marginata TaxID=1093978 RepID=A0AAV4EL44_9GAST|nr:transmembrane protein 179-like [Elysia marginata]
MAHAYDIQVLGQSLVYFVIVIFGFVVAVPLGITVVQFDMHCVLYTDVDWVNATFAQYELSNPTICNFPVWTFVFTCILYSLGVGLYFLYAACRSNDPNVGFQMWVMPFLLVNALILILLFICCCIMSVGLKTTCDNLLKGRKKGNTLQTCSDAEDKSKFDWNKGKTSVNASDFYSFSKTSEVAGWITFLIWIVQMALGVLRFIRNRRQRSQDMGYEDNEPPKNTASDSDTENFAAVNPSA